MTTHRLLWIPGAVSILLALSAAATAQTSTPTATPLFTAAPGSPFKVGDSPSSVAVGDFNGDHIPDLAIANHGGASRAGTVTVLLGNGTGGFTVAKGSPFRVGSNRFPTLSRPVSVAAGDFNGDAKPDLAIANSGEDTVTVLLGDGTGGFTKAPGSPFQVGRNPWCVAAGDFNGDRKPDLAIANNWSASVTVLLGNGKGGFTEAPGSPFPAGSVPNSVAVGDFNGDAKPDLAISNIFGGTVTVLLGNGTGGLTEAPGSPFPVGSAPNSVAVGDFNGDGKPDLAIANAGSNNHVTVLLGDGKGGFAAAPGSPFPVGSWPHSVAVGDFNGDGKPDLATANAKDNNVSVLLGNGTGGFAAAPGSPFMVGSAPNSVAVGDFNGDGKLDLATANRDSNNVSVLLNSYSGPATPTPAKQ